MLVAGCKKASKSSNSDIPIEFTGVILGGSLNGKATIWEEGVASFLTNDTTNGKRANTILLKAEGADLYAVVVEQQQNSKTVTLFKNKLPQLVVPNIDIADATVFNGAIYIVTTDYKVFKNGSLLRNLLVSSDYNPPPPLQFPIKIAVAPNGDVICVSSAVTNNTHPFAVGKRTAVVWKNLNFGALLSNFNGGSGDPHSITIGTFNNTVFVAGTSAPGTPCVWKSFGWSGSNSGIGGPANFPVQVAADSTNHYVTMVVNRSANTRAILFYKNAGVPQFITNDDANINRLNATAVKAGMLHIVGVGSRNASNQKDYFYFQDTKALEIPDIAPTDNCLLDCILLR